MLVDVKLVLGGGWTDGVGIRLWGGVYTDCSEG